MRKCFKSYAVCLHHRDAFQDLVNLVVRQVSLSGLQPSMWTEEHHKTIHNFVTSTEDNDRLLVVYLNTNTTLEVVTQIPPFQVEQLFYMIRKKDVKMSKENFISCVQFELVSANYLENLLRIMSGVYGPMFFQNKSWPDSIRNDFVGYVHKFMATLTDFKYKMQGKTVLYVPNEGLTLTVEEAAKNKEYVQRLEGKNKKVFYS